VPQSPYDSILFDFDGVLADTEPLHFECWREVLKGLGANLEWEYYAPNCIGTSEHDTIRAYLNLTTPPLAFDALWAEYPRKKELFRAMMAKSVPLAPDARELLKDLHADYRMAVVSSSNRREVEPALETAGIRQYFDALVCGLEVPKLKPAPDPYLRAAELLDARKPLVVEDSAAGVASATAAGFDHVRIASVVEMASAVRAALVPSGR
jgi:HAD superfamily hydrolase (TIGR01509 family)